MSVVFVPVVWLLLVGALAAVVAIPVSLVALAVGGVRRLRAAADERRRELLHLRAGDEDRLVAAALLREHFALGRLTSAELEERSGRAWTARTPAELLGLLEDLPPAPPREAARRVRPWLRLAALYNLCWGSGVVLAGPSVAWRCVGMLVLVWAPAYWWASRDPLRHAHVVAVALLGKVLGPLGFLVSVLAGALPPRFAVVILANDVIWWPAFARFLRAAAQAAGGWRPFAGGANVTGSALPSSR